MEKPKKLTKKQRLELLEQKRAAKCLLRQADLKKMSLTTVTAGITACMFGQQLVGG